jgi:hypothetical protein
MDAFMTVAFFAALPDLLRIADAVADWTRPGRHRSRYASRHASLRMR